jgi:hypothetical protein
VKVYYSPAESSSFSDFPDDHGEPDTPLIAKLGKAEALVGDKHRLNLNLATDRVIGQTASSVVRHDDPDFSVCRCAAPIKIQVSAEIDLPPVSCGLSSSTGRVGGAFREELRAWLYVEILEAGSDVSPIAGERGLAHPTLQLAG